MMKQKIPMLLVLLRLLAGLIIIPLSYARVENYNAFAISLLTFGLISDIFDGIIARKLNVSTQKLRRLDSSVDQFFFIAFGVATYIQCPLFFVENIVLLVILFAFEAATYATSYLKFRKEIATHSIGAKLWTLLLFATLIQLIMSCQSVVLFGFCFWVGIITRAEIIAIVLTLKEWTNDVPSLSHAIKLRKGIGIKRNKLFNG